MVSGFFTRLNERYPSSGLLILYCIITGITSALAALALKTAVFYIHHFLTIVPGSETKNYIYLLFPLAGILLTVAFIRFFIGPSFGKGSAYILKSIAKKESNVEKHTSYSHIISSALTVGFGGSAGLESPIVVTGSSIGSLYGSLFGLPYKEKTTLLACGAAAGIAAVFNAPLAGVMFALEVLLVDLSLSAFLPLIVSAASGALLSNILLNEKIQLSFILHQPFNYKNVPYYFGLALLTGIVSVYYIRVYHRIEKFFTAFGERYILRAITGGTLLGILVLLFPPLFGEGYSGIVFLTGAVPAELYNGSILSGITGNIWWFIMLIGATALLKVVAASLTIGSGGNGGNFAPSLFVGAFIGFAYAQLLKQLTGADIPVANFTIVGMAGILCGVMHAPLTAVFLIAEITGGYGLMVPLMIVSSISYLVVRRYEPWSLEKKHLARKGELITEDRDKNILLLIECEDIIETDYLPVNYKSSIRSFSELLSRSRRNLFPVLDDEGNYLGIISMDSIRQVLFELNEYKDMPAIELMNTEYPAAAFEDSTLAVMQKLEAAGVWNIPILKEGKYIGFISRSGLLTKYREHLQANN